MAVGERILNTVGGAFKGGIKWALYALAAVAAVGAGLGIYGLITAGWGIAAAILVGVSAVPLLPELWV